MSLKEIYGSFTIPNNKFNEDEFPQLPKNKIFLSHNFEIIPTLINETNYFFNIQKVVKNSYLFNRIEIKEEFYDNNNVINSFKTQIQALLIIDHPTFNHLFGIIKFPSKISNDENANNIYDVFPYSDEKPLALIMPFISLKNLLNQSSLTITQKFNIIYGIAAGMYYLHKKEITHLNLKPENILLNDEFEPIINIDITTRPKSKKKIFTNFIPIFSFPYVSPEFLTFQNNQGGIFNDKKSDVYSFAMIVYFLISGKHPFKIKHKYQHIMKKAIQKKRPKTKGVIPFPFNKLIKNCWSTDPIKRYSFKTILKLIGSEDFVCNIEDLDIEKFQSYQKKVVDKEFIFPINKSKTEQGKNKINQFEEEEEIEEYNFDINRFEILNKIGNGSYGKVYRVKEKETGSFYAAKISMLMLDDET